MKKKEKGQGVRTNNAITLSQRWDLFRWCERNKDDHATLEEKADSASLELGFVITTATLANHWHVVNGKIRIYKPRIEKPRKMNHAELIGIISQLAAEVAQLKARMQ